MEITLGADEPMSPAGSNGSLLKTLASHDCCGRIKAPRDINALRDSWDFVGIEDDLNRTLSHPVPLFYSSVAHCRPRELEQKKDSSCESSKSDSESSDPYIFK